MSKYPFPLKWRNVVLTDADFDEHTITGHSALFPTDRFTFSFENMIMSHSDEAQFLKMATDRYMAGVFCSNDALALKGLAIDYVKDIIQHPYEWTTVLTERTDTPFDADDVLERTLVDVIINGKGEKLFCFMGYGYCAYDGTDPMTDYRILEYSGFEMTEEELKKRDIYKLEDEYGSLCKQYIRDCSLAEVLDYYKDANGKFFPVVRPEELLNVKEGTYILDDLKKQKGNDLL